LRAVPPSDIKLLAVVKAELSSGARRSARVAESLALLRQFFAPVESLALDDRCAEDYRLIRADLAS
jgi:predicted nucleic acid-binding protein